jgi:tetratricopeptide (TPR) repeat protein
MYMIQDESKKLWRWSVLLTLLFTIVLVQWPARAQGVKAKISRVGDATHLEFEGSTEWNYELQKVNDSEVKIIVPAIEGASILELQAWTCPYIKSIAVNTNAPDGRNEINIQLADKNVESFDYQTDSPANLIFDFYKQIEEINPEKKLEKIVSNVKAGAKQDATVTNRKLPEKKYTDDYKRVARKPAGDELLSISPQNGNAVSKLKKEDPLSEIRFSQGVYDAADPNYNRFRLKNYQISENSIIASRQNIYLQFPNLTIKTNRFNELMNDVPDYEILPTEEAENKEARLLYTLYKNDRLASFLETYSYFIKKYPASKYSEIVRNLYAEVNIRLYRRDKKPFNYDEFVSQYKYLNVTYPDSALTERNSFLVAYAYLDKGLATDALREIQFIKKKYPKSEEMENLNFAAAESLFQLKQNKGALEIYKTMATDDSIDRIYSVEAHFREADVYYQNKDFKQAQKLYKAAQQKFPSYILKYPNAQYNIAESEFWMGNYQSSLDSYIEFLKNFPTHDYGGFTLTRIGELLQILGANQSQSIGAFLEAYFRFPSSQGTDVARIRMLAQGLKSMKEREAKRALDEIDSLTQKSTLNRFQEFATLMKGEGLAKRGQFQDSLELLVSYFQKHPTTSNLPVFKGRILRNISDILKDTLQKDDNIGVLDFYGKYSGTWLKNANRIDVEYFRAQAYEKSNVLKEAELIYKSILTQLTSIQNKDEYKERLVNEHLPTLDQLNLRLAQIASLERRDQDAFQYLSKIKADSFNEEEETEKTLLSANVYEHLGNVKNAISQLEKLLAEKKFLSPENKYLPATYLKVAQLAFSEKNYDKTEKYLNLLDQQNTKNTSLSDDIKAYSLELRADWLNAKGEKLAAVEKYTQLLDTFESKRMLSSIRFKTGKILFDEGDLKGAEKIWSSLQGKTGEYYKKLAQEKLAQAEWQDNYKKYIQRIPAAADLK